MPKRPELRPDPLEESHISISIEQSTTTEPHFSLMQDLEYSPDLMSPNDWVQSHEGSLGTKFNTQGKPKKKRIRLPEELPKSVTKITKEKKEKKGKSDLDKKNH